MHVLAIGGMGRVGKSTVADYIEIESINHDCRPIRLSFADPVKVEACKETGYDDWRILKQEKPDLYRKVCQDIGDEGRPSSWVDKMQASLIELQIDELKQDTNLFEEYLVIIDDVRYPNELEMLKDFEATTLFVYAGTRELPNMIGREHESEEMSQKIEMMIPGYSEIFEWSIFNEADNITLEEKLDERMDYLVGSSPSRFGKPCPCNSCKAFKTDIRVEEIVDTFQRALDSMMESDDYTAEEKAEMREELEAFIQKIKDGDIKPEDVFPDERWTSGDEGDPDEDA